MSFRFMLGASISWIGVGCLVAITCRRLAVVFDLIGAVFGSFEVFIYPGFFWYTLCARHSRFGALVSYVLWTLGAIMIVAGTTVTLDNVLNPSTS